MICEALKPYFKQVFYNWRGIKYFSSYYVLASPDVKAVIIEMSLEKFFNILTEMNTDLAIILKSFYSLESSKSKYQSDVMYFIQ